MGRNIKKQGSEFWNANPCGGLWSTYAEFIEWMQRTEPYIYGILDGYDWQGKHVLEVGCGQGTTLNYLPRLGARVFGIDMSEKSVAHARVGAKELGHIRHVGFSVSDAENLPFTNESFDAVLSVGVLHHTQNTRAGVHEIRRVLKPGGLAIVMLYRSGNPKWWATRVIRHLSFLLDKLYGRAFVIATHLQQRQKSRNSQGTALLELFGVPILKAFSNSECQAMFLDYANVSIRNYQPGFERLSDIIPYLLPLRKFLRRIDGWTQQCWGFYQVIEARK